MIAKDDARSRSREGTFWVITRWDSCDVDDLLRGRSTVYMPEAVAVSTDGRVVLGPAYQGRMSPKQRDALVKNLRAATRGLAAGKRTRKVKP